MDIERGGRGGRGAVLIDYDNDGDLDLYLANQDMPPTFFRNDVGGSRHWLGVKLVGRPEAGSNRDAIGARLTVVTAGGRRIRELDGGNSYCGQSDRRVYFGLGDEMIVQTLEVRWPSRRVHVMKNVRADQILTVEEPESLPQIASLMPTTREPGAATAVRSEPSPQVVLAPQEREALLAGLEERVRRQRDDVALASKYRSQCVELGEHQRSVRFFERLANENPAVPNLRLQLAAAYVDKIPTCEGMAAIVSKGTLARQALDQIDLLTEAGTTWWPAVYSRAMNHLHWPRALKHSAAAARDFRKCLELQIRQGGSANARSYYVRAYVGLGDALAKDGHFSTAKEAWQAGLNAFPQDPELKERAALKNSRQARDFVENVRNLEEQIDTDFSFLLSP